MICSQSISTYRDKMKSDLKIWPKYNRESTLLIFTNEEDNESLKTTQQRALMYRKMTNIKAVRYFRSWTNLIVHLWYEPHLHLCGPGSSPSCSTVS